MNCIKRLRERKTPRQVQVKEIKFRPKISIHDYTFKIRHVQRFLKEIRKRMRNGVCRLDQVFEDVAELIKRRNVRTQPWAVSALLSPTKSGEKMPKLKTHKGAQKRFKVTGKKKVVHNKAYKSHILTKKSAKRKRTLRKSALISDMTESDQRYASLCVLNVLL